MTRFVPRTLDNAWERQASRLHALLSHPFLVMQARRLRSQAEALLLLEQTIERIARAGAWFGNAAGGSRLVRDEKVAEVCLLAIGDPLGLGLAAPVAHRGVVMKTVQTAVNIGRAARTLIGP